MKIIYISPTQLSELPLIWKIFLLKYRKHIDINRTRAKQGYERWNKSVKKSYRILMDYTVRRQKYLTTSTGKAKYPFTDFIRAFLLFLDYEYPEFKIVYDSSELEPSGDQICEIRENIAQLVERRELCILNCSNHCKTCKQHFAWSSSWKTTEKNMEEHFMEKKCCDKPILKVGTNDFKAHATKIENIDNSISSFEKQLKLVGQNKKLFGDFHPPESESEPEPEPEPEPKPKYKYKSKYKPKPEEEEEELVADIV